MTPTGPAGQLARVASPHATLATLGEGGVIAALGRQGLAGPPGALGIGDDAALVPLGHPGVVASVDTLVEGVHFRLATTTPEDLGWKVLAVNLSDLAAMGARPVAVLLALSAPASLPARWVEGLAAGLHALAARHGVWLAGGDTTGSPGPVVVSVTALGEPGPGGRVLTRAGARPGDVVFTTSRPGLAGAGLLALEHPAAMAGLPAGLVAEACEAHRRPCPHVAAGLALAALTTRLALLDDSDGLARSAQLLAEGASAGVVLEAARLALAPATRAIAAAHGHDPLALALHGGEDYGLVGACAAEAWPHVAQTLAAEGFPGQRVGRVEASCRGAWVEAAGELTPLTGAAGHAHFGG